MDSKGDAYDNAVCEAFFATLKKELIRRRSWPTRRERPGSRGCSDGRALVSNSSSVCHRSPDPVYGPQGAAAKRDIRAPLPTPRFAAARRPVSCHHPVLEVGDAGRLDAPDLLELHLRVPEVVEKTSTVAEHHRNDVELKFVQQSRCQVLPSDVGAAPKPDVFAAGGLPCLFERGLDSVGDEVERGPSLHLHGITRVMGENEHGVVVGRVVAPPARPLLVAPGTTMDRAEHVSAHHASPDVLARFLEYPRALVHLAALLAVGLAPGCQRNHPIVEPLAALAERVLHALVRAGDEAV